MRKDALKNRKIVHAALKTIKQNDALVRELTQLDWPSLTLCKRIQHIMIVAFGATALLLKSLFCATESIARITFIDSVELVDKYKNIIFSDDNVHVLIISISGETAEAIFYAHISDASRTTIISGDGPLSNMLPSTHRITSTCRMHALSEGSRFFLQTIGVDCKSINDNYINSIHCALNKGPMAATIARLLSSRCFIVPDRYLTTFRWFRHIWEEITQESILVVGQTECLHGRIEWLHKLNNEQVLIVEQAKGYASSLQNQREQLIESLLHNVIKIKTLNLGQLCAICCMRLLIEKIKHDNRPINQHTLRCKALMSACVTTQPPN